MKINLICICGACFRLTDDDNLKISDDGKADKNGDTLIIQKQSREWLASHEKCYEFDILDGIPNGVVVH